MRAGSQISDAICAASAASIRSAVFSSFGAFLSCQATESLPERGFTSRSIL